MKNKTKGLLVFTLFERFSFYLFIGIFVFYFTKFLNLSDELTGNIYTGFIWTMYLSPIVFGYFADKYGYLRFFHFGIIAAIIGYFLIPIKLFSSKEIDILLPLIFLSLGAGSLRMIVPVMLGTNSFEMKDEKIYTKFIWYSLVISLGAFLAQSITKEANEQKESLIGVIVISGIFLIIGYLIWFFSNRFKKIENFPISQTYHNNYKNNKLLISMLLISLPIFIILRGVIYYLNFKASPEFLNISNSWISNIDLLLTIIFGLILIKTKPLDSEQLVNLIKTGLIILASVIMTILIKILLFPNGFEVILTSVLFIFVKAASTLIGPLIMFLVFDCAKSNQKGLIFGIYLAITAIPSAMPFLTYMLIDDALVLGLSLYILTLGIIIIYLRYFFQRIYF